MADDEHFREVILALTDTDELVFEEALSRICPASPGVCLVLDRSDASILDGREDVGLDAVLSLLGGLRRQGRCDPRQCHDSDKFLHL